MGDGAFADDEMASRRNKRQRTKHSRTEAVSVDRRGHAVKEGDRISMEEDRISMERLVEDPYEVQEMTKERLPDGWLSYTDDSTGRQYYHNVDTVEYIIGTLKQERSHG